MTAHTNQTDPTDPASPLLPGEPCVRQQTILGLRALAVFLEANPDVPVNEHGVSYLVFPRDCDDATAAARVDHTAALLGVGVTDRRSHGGHYYAERTFGRITYGIAHIPEQAKREARARDSYYRNIVLDTDQTSTQDDAQDEGTDTGRAA